MKNCSLIISFYFLFLVSCKNGTNRKVEKVSKVNTTRIKAEADSFYRINDYPRAIILFNELIASDSTKGEYYYKRGFSYSMLFNAEQAIKDYSKAIKLEYRKGDAYQNIGINYSTLNDSLAIYYLNKSLEIDPNNAKAKRLIKECIDRLSSR